MTTQNWTLGRSQAKPHSPNLVSSLYPEGLLGVRPARSHLGKCPAPPHTVSQPFAALAEGSWPLVKRAAGRQQLAKY